MTPRPAGGGSASVAEPFADDRVCNRILKSLESPVVQRTDADTLGSPSAAAGRNQIEQKETKGTKKAVVDRDDSVMRTNGDAPVCPLFPSFPSVRNLRVPQRTGSLVVRKVTEGKKRSREEGKDVAVKNLI